ncbi:MAG: WYL domain-containing protein [Muribaculaceae bacterium]|nr:WYL domain-containing protein [Muribaculaceae bacterium]
MIFEYQSLKARQSEALVVYPYLLKECRNRWFLICEKSSIRAPQVNIFALDRIQSVYVDKEHPFKKCVDFDPEHFLMHVGLFRKSLPLAGLVSAPAECAIICLVQITKSIADLLFFTLEFMRLRF